MMGTNLRSALLDNADLSDSEITESDFQTTDLNGTQFKRAVLFGVKFDSKYIDRNGKEPTDFEGATIRVCSFRNTNFQGLNLRMQSLQEAA